MSHENVPIGERLVPNVWPHQRDAYTHVLAAIDAVHSVPHSVPSIEVQTGRFMDAPGAYVYRGTGESIAIRIWVFAARPSMTLAHEIGHFIDHKGLGGSLSRPLTGLPTERRKLPRNVRAALDDWERTVRASEGVRDLIALRQDPFVRAQDGNMIDVNAEIDFGYVLRTQELWARSYLQYIATRSADCMLTAELNELIDAQERAMVSITQQWTHADFRAIMASLDRLFGELEWLR